MKTQNSKLLRTIRRSQLGFSAIEMLVAVALLMVVLGVVVRGVQNVQQRNRSESSNVDAVQDTRNFIDQMVRDVHGVGYPPPAAISTAQPYCNDPTTGAITGMRMNANVACGVVLYSPTQVIYEGDLDGTGAVSVVFLNLVPGNGNRCPCTLQRGVVTKTAWAGNPANYPVPGVQYFTTVNGVLNSGNNAFPPPSTTIFGVTLPGTGNYAAYASADVFDAYDANAQQVTVNCSLGDNANPGVNPSKCSSIRSLQITVNVVPAFADPTIKQFKVYSITSKARVNF
jgi:type II secretory pathway pseudopilin PulG